MVYGLSDIIGNTEPCVLKILNVQYSIFNAQCSVKGVCDAILFKIAQESTISTRTL